MTNGFQRYEKDMRKNDIKELTEIEHVLQKTGMYLGDITLGKHLKWIIQDEKLIKSNQTYCPAMLKMFDEIISNSIDEALRTDFKHANKIDVIIEHDYITVKDNGRGIPVRKAKGSNKIQSLTAFTSLRAGGNFGNEEVVSIGTHGLGSTLVNIMSKDFYAETSDGKKCMKLSCSDNMSNIRAVYTKSNKQYTIVKYKPDYKRFGMLKLTDTHLNLMLKRVHDLSICYPSITFTFNRCQVAKKGFKTYIKMIDRSHELIETNNYKFAVVSSDEYDQISFANGIDTFDGGTHIDYISGQVINRLQVALNKKYKKFKIKPSDIKNHLLFVLITNKIKNLKFKGQTKETVNNNIKEYKGVLDLECDKFFIKIIKNQDLIDPIIETYKLKQEAKERVELKAAKRNVSKKKVLKHIAATHKHASMRTIFICEGNSAAGIFLLVRDAKRQGVYPLRGKPLNINGKTNKTILSNVEYSDLMNILGLEMGKKVSLQVDSNRWYDIDGIICNENDFIKIENKWCNVRSIV